MKLFNTQLTTDKFAGTVSLVCALQCLFMPSFFIATSGLVSLSIDNEFVHSIILFIAVPVSLFALLLGLENHKSKLIYLIYVCLQKNKLRGKSLPLSTHHLKMHKYSGQQY